MRLEAEPCRSRTSRRASLLLHNLRQQGESVRGCSQKAPVRAFAASGVGAAAVEETATSETHGDVTSHFGGAGALSSATLPLEPRASRPEGRAPVSNDSQMNALGGARPRFSFSFCSSLSRADDDPYPNRTQTLPRKV